MPGSVRALSQGDKTSCDRQTAPCSPGLHPHTQCLIYTERYNAHTCAHTHVLSDHTFNEYNFHLKYKRNTQKILHYQQYEIEMWRIRIE